MTALLPERDRLAPWLLIVFAFSAWNLTGLANVALGLLSLLFLLDLPGNWTRLRRDPGFLLMLGSLALTAMLALRAASLLPQTAPEQWRAIVSWSLPFLFVVTAWWLRGREPLMRKLLVAAAVGLVVGVARRMDWSLLGEILGGLRYHFGYAALGLAFIVSVMLVGLVLFRGRILGLTLAGRPRPAIGWSLWLLGLAFTLALLVVTEARGSALSLALVTLGYALVGVRGRPGGTGTHRRIRAGLLLAVLALMSLILWTSRERIYYDWKSLNSEPAAAETTGLRYDSSSAIRLNLYRLGLELFTARPLLGWGPGTSATDYLVPSQAIPLSGYDVAHASQASHLHSVPIEILVRFGLVGAGFALMTLLVMARAYRRLAGESEDPALRRFLVIGGLLTLFFFFFDFRLIHLDLRFFLILFFGMVYGYSYREAPPGAAHRAEEGQ